MPAHPETVTGAEEARFRRVFPHFALGGRVQADCARPGDQVFIEGCFDASGDVGVSSISFAAHASRALRARAATAVSAASATR